MRKIVSIIVFLVFSSVTFAEHETLTSTKTQPEWKWATVFNSVVLISGEKTPEVMVEQIFLFKVTLNDGRYNTVHLVGMRAKQGKMTSIKIINSPTHKIFLNKQFQKIQLHL